MKTNSMALAQWLDVKEGKDSLAFKKLERWDVAFGLSVKIVKRAIGMMWKKGGGDL